MSLLSEHLPHAEGEPQSAPDDLAVAPHSGWLLLAIPVCLVLAGIELRRALDGHDRAWVYAFEWPTFAGWFYYMYRKLSRHEPMFTPYRAEDYADQDPEDNE